MYFGQLDKLNDLSLILPIYKICIALFSLLGRQAPMDLIPAFAYFVPTEYPKDKHLQFVFDCSHLSHNYQKLIKFHIGHRGLNFLFELYFEYSVLDKARAILCFYSLMFFCSTYIKTYVINHSSFYYLTEKLYNPVSQLFNIYSISIYSSPKKKKKGTLLKIVITKKRCIWYTSYIFFCVKCGHIFIIVWSFSKLSLQFSIALFNTFVH